MSDQRKQRTYDGVSGVENLIYLLQTGAASPNELIKAWLLSDKQAGMLQEEQMPPHRSFIDAPRVPSFPELYNRSMKCPILHAALITHMLEMKTNSVYFLPSLPTQAHADTRCVEQALAMAAMQLSEENEKLRYVLAENERLKRLLAEQARGGLSVAENGQLDLLEESGTLSIAAQDTQKHTGALRRVAWWISGRWLKAPKGGQHYPKTPRPVQTPGAASAKKLKSSG